jgi:PIN domain nuclease of toxin-antitoxin system
VTDLRAAIIDTHALLFHAARSRALGPRAAAHLAACEKREALAYVPAPVVWECSLLARASRINLRRTVRAFFDDLFSNPAYQPLDLTNEHVFMADELRFSRDPFDALIVAAARALDLPLLTRDAEIRASGVVKVIW